MVNVVEIENPETLLVVPSSAPRPLAPIGASLLAASSLVACGGGGGGTAPGPGPSPAPAPGTTNTLPTSDEQAARFLLQAQLSATDGDIASVRSKGYSAWLNEQFALAIGPSGFDWLNSRGYGVADINTRFYNATYPADGMMWNQLFTAPDPLRKRVALALSEMMVVSASGLNVTWRSFMAAAYWDMLNTNAFGNFRTLLEAVTLNPAMGYYLNTRGNQKEDAATGRQPDENYAREVMQLFTIGLVQLNTDGSEKLSASGARQDSYTQSDISNLARVFTGWDFDNSQNAPVAIVGDTGTVQNTAFTRLPMVLNASRHSTLAATFLGTSIAANTEGKAALKTALDTLFNHANVGPFFGRQLIQRLVTSNPSPAYVGRVTSAFNNNGSGVRGDLKAVISAVLLDDEARGAAGLTQPAFGKLREPILRLVQWGRTFGVASARNSWKIGDLSNPATQLGQSPLRSPSVFNFFRPGYIPPSTALAASQQAAPEFQIVNESSVGGYINYMQTTIRSGIFVNAPDLPQSASNASNGYDITASYAEVLPLATDAAALVRKVSLLLAAGQVSAQTQTSIVNALNANPVTDASSASARLDRVAAAVLLVMACPEYLIQK
ncbi:MAG: DUF1800 domain-containing protein [Polaromonas sp.]|nr:DUF1800 domain-containing protein [Polaromonas sp.]